MFRSDLDRKSQLAGIRNELLNQRDYTNNIKIGLVFEQKVLLVLSKFGQGANISCSTGTGHPQRRRL